MATYFKYKDRDLDKRVDWSKVASGFSDRLAVEDKRRVKLKEDKDEEFRTTAQNETDKRVLGQSENLNNWSIDFGDQIQKRALEAHRGLKNGTLDHREFSQIMQRLSDNTDNTYLALKEFQTSYAEHQELYDKGEVGALDQYNMELMESMSMFNNSKAMVGEDGNASIDIYDVDDEGNLAIGLGPKQTVAITAFRQGVNNKYKVLNTDASVKKFVDGIGDTEYITKGMNGNIIEYYTVKDKSGRANMVNNGQITQADLDLVDTFDQLSDAWVDTVFANPENIFSVLGDTLTSQGYKLTLDAAQQNDTTVLLELKNGRLVPKFDGAAGEAQKEAARNALKVKALGAVNKSVEVKTASKQVFQKNEAAYARTEKKATLSNDIGMLHKLYNPANQGEVDEAVAHFRDKGVNLSVERNENGVYIKTQKGDIPLDFKAMSEPQFIRAYLQAVNSGGFTLSEVDDIIDRSGYNASTQKKKFTSDGGEEEDVYSLAERTIDKPAADVAAKQEAIREENKAKQTEVTRLTNNINSALEKFSLDAEGITASTFTNMFSMFGTSYKTTVNQNGDKFTITVGKDSITLDKAADDLENEKSNLMTFMYGIAEKKGGGLTSRWSTHQLPTFREVHLR
jgi:hypothetical protein